MPVATARKWKILVRIRPPPTSIWRVQFFFLTIFRFRTMSLRESKLDTVRVVEFVAYHAANGAQLRFTLLVLSVRSGRERGDDHQHAKEASSNLHFWSPFSGCIRKTTVCSLPPPFASIVRV